MSRSFVEPDWISFDSKADWRDSLQYFNLHGDYIGGDEGWATAADAFPKSADCSFESGCSE